MLSHWKICKESIHLFLRDNASNMDCAMKDTDMGTGALHSLQLVVHDGVLYQQGVSD